jgi:hypothetical protein
MQEIAHWMNLRSVLQDRVCSALGQLATLARTKLQPVLVLRVVGQGGLDVSLAD